MKRLIVLAFAVATLAACKGSSSADGKDSAATSTPAVPAADAAVISFEHGMYNFGKINQGDKIHYNFKFKNTGKSPLIITNATATCGCTIPEPPKDPIQPGASGVIKVNFNSAGKMGMQDKIVTITSNANPATTEVHLIGEVKEPTAL